MKAGFKMGLTRGNLPEFNPFVKQKYNRWGSVKLLIQYIVVARLLSL
jgi:hypothetical protein